MASCIFGPVASRRLGRSLGVDLVPLKTCTYDCVYCQLGRTTNKTTERKEWVDLDKVIDELQRKLGTSPDYITLSGSGEPTLFSRTGELIARIKDMTEIPVAVLTNGSLLWWAEVRRSIMQADLVAPSLDAGNDALFQRINRPHPAISFENMLDGLIRFRQEHAGRYQLEVLVLGGLTTDKEIEELADCVRRIDPELVQLNTVTRPAAEAWAVPVPREQLEVIAHRLGDNTEIIADHKRVYGEKTLVSCREDILTLLRRRPCSIDDIIQGLGIDRREVVKYIEELTCSGEIVADTQGRKVYYKVVTTIRP